MQKWLSGQMRRACAVEESKKEEGSIKEHWWTIRDLMMKAEWKKSKQANKKEQQIKEQIS